MHFPKAPVFSQLSGDGSPAHVEEFKKRGFHSLWLSVDYEKVDPITKEESPDVLMKQAMRKFWLPGLRLSALMCAWLTLLMPSSHT